MNELSSISITPFLTVTDAKKAIEFYITAWGAIAVEKFDRPNDKITALISIAGARFWVGDEEREFGNIGPDSKIASPVRMILQTSDADHLFEKALQTGATLICPMTTEDDWRIGKLKDPFGHIWEIGYTLLQT